MLAVLGKICCPNGEKLRRLLQKKLTFCVQDIDLCKSMFSKADRDKDGKINASELKGFLEELGENVSDSNVKELLKEIDADSDGVSLNSSVTKCKETLTSIG